MDTLARQIKNQALSLGYENCGIIKIDAVAGYADKLKERISQVRWGWFQFRQFKKFARPQNAYPWAKSIIVTLNNNSVYNIPEALNGIIAKDYLVDGRLNKESDAYKRNTAFEEFLKSLNIRAEGEPKFGITALRFAAQEAGLGLIRKNNFFYTDNGSLITIYAWAIDHELELIDTVGPKHCPEHCQKCIDACPTKALSSPYITSLFDCVSYLTSISVEKGMGIPAAKLRANFGGRVYGCDACQDVCPFNSGKWTGGRDFPGLAALADKLSPEKIMEMDYEEITKVFSPKFWYVSPKNAWKWKINALTAMENLYSENYNEAIRLGLNDKDRRVRRFAKRICRKFGLIKGRFFCFWN